MRKTLLGVFVVGLLVGCTRINPGHVGIEVNMAGSQRGVQDFVVKTGWVYYVPGKTQVFEYPTYVQSYVWTHDEKEGSEKNEEITFTTRDQMKVSVDVNLSYSLSAEKVPAFYVKFRSDDIKTFTHGFLRSVARDCFNEAGGRYQVEQIMGDNAAFIKEARVCVEDHVGKYGVEIEQFGIIGAPRPPDGVIAAINLKVQAQQTAMQKQNEVAQAEADARKTVAEANGFAAATLAKATAQAKANKTLAASITPQLLEYTKLQQWDGQLPQVTGGQAWVTVPGRPAK